MTNINPSKIPNKQIQHGEEFVSETDTEVIPKLCRYVYRSLKRRSGGDGACGVTSGPLGVKPPAHACLDAQDDTVFIPRDADQSMKQSIVPFPRLVMAVLQRLEGAYAILIRSSHYPGQLVACKRGSPLIFGLGHASQQKQHTGETAAADLEERPPSFSRVSDSSKRFNT
jgi:glutamine---fructose-6-phosphate transaminase (isomerizing)